MFEQAWNTSQSFNILISHLVIRYFSGSSSVSHCCRRCWTQLDENEKRMQILSVLVFCERAIRGITEILVIASFDYDKGCGENLGEHQ